MQFVIFHGAYGSKDGNWYPWLNRELTNLGHKVIVEQYPIDDFESIQKGQSDTMQNLQSWTAHFEKNVLPQLDKGQKLVFIGHSLGPVFILHMVQKLNIQLDSAIFVSPFLESLNIEASWKFDAVNKSFYKTDFDWNNIKRLIPFSFVLYGENDQYVPRKLFLDFAQKMNSSVIPVRNGGHMGGDFKELPIILELCKTRIGL